MGYLTQRQVMSMAVDRIEEYRQQNRVDILKVVLKPTKKFPEGSNFFYAPADAINLVEKYTWCLHTEGKNRVCVIARDNSTYHPVSIHFHTKLFEFYNNYTWQGDIDHKDMITYDNADENLEPVTTQQNAFNRMSRGYLTDTRIKPASFTACVVVDGKLYRPYSAVRNEVNVCITQNYLEQVCLRETLGSQYYMFDFLKYRRGSEDLLDLERTGKISEEEATYRHILRYSQNAWYMLRYGLEQYFKDNHIPIPEYRLDEYGLMIHPITGNRLCPFQ